MCKRTVSTPDLREDPLARPWRPLKVSRSDSGGIGLVGDELRNSSGSAGLGEAVKDYIRSVDAITWYTLMEWIRQNIARPMVRDLAANSLAASRWTSEELRDILKVVSAGPKPSHADIYLLRTMSREVYEGIADFHQWCQQEQRTAMSLATLRDLECTGPDPVERAKLQIGYIYFGRLRHMAKAEEILERLTKDQPRGANPNGFVVSLLLSGQYHWIFRDSKKIRYEVMREALRLMALV